MRHSLLRRAEACPQGGIRKNIILTEVGDLACATDEIADVLEDVFKTEVRREKKIFHHQPVCSGRQYAASGFLETLKRLAAEEYLVLGITRADLSFPGLNYVFGLSNPEDGVCVVSMYRFLDRKEVAQSDRPAFERTLKTAVHELGHLYGLSHCKDRKCAMFFSFTVADTDYKQRQFCGRCTEKLNRIELP